jgi:hypothetical protein
VPSEQIFKALNTMHRGLVRATGGRLGWYAPGYKMPVVELTTTGRKSGEPRTIMLTSPYQDGSTMVLVASAAGNDRHPAWYLNLLANPEVTVPCAASPPAGCGLNRRARRSGPDSGPSLPERTPTTPATSGRRSVRSRSSC